MPSSAFITGATGVVGSHLLSMLVAEGNDVTALVRTEASAEALTMAGVRPVLGDILEPAGWTNSMSGMDTVYHVAGVNETCPSDPETMMKVNVDGVVAVIEAASRSGAGRVVLTSSVAAIGEAKGALGTEETQHGGSYLSAYARSKHLGEVAGRKAAAKRGLDLVVVNPASVQGPGRSTGSAEMLLRVLRSNRPILFDATVSVVDIEDSSRGHLLAAEFGTPGERYILSGVTISVAEIVEIVNSITESPVNPRWISHGAVRTLGVPAAALVSMLKRGSDVCPELVRTMLHGHRFSNARSREDLGLEYTPFESTVARTLAWFEDEGHLRARS